MFFPEARGTVNGHSQAMQLTRARLETNPNVTLLTRRGRVLVMIRRSRGAH